MWTMLASAAMAGVSSMMQGSAAAQQGAAAAESQHLQAAQHNKQIRHQNEETVRTNIENTIRTGYRVGLLNMQLGQSKRDAVRQGFDQSVAAKQALGHINANQAAAGTIGASADVVQGEVAQKLDQARAERGAAWDLTLENFNIELNSVIQQGMDSLQGGSGTVQDPVKVQQGMSPLMQGVLGAAGSFASNYASRTMQLGLGSASSPPAARQGRALPGGQGLQFGGGTGLRL